MLINNFFISTKSSQDYKIKEINFSSLAFSPGVLEGKILSKNFASNGTTRPPYLFIANSASCALCRRSTNKTSNVIGLLCFAATDQSKRVLLSSLYSREGENMAAMADCFPKSPDPISRHRSQYKCSTPPWKEQYRKVIWSLHLLYFFLLMLTCTCDFSLDL